MKEKNESFQACRIDASFLARLVTLCVNTYVMMCFGSGARDELFRALGKYFSDDMPLTSASEEWFTAENAFLGIFTDWSDQELPAIPMPTSFPTRHEGVAMLQRLLESAFSVGFVTAKDDRCHLLATYFLRDDLQDRRARRRLQYSNAARGWCRQFGKHQCPY